MSTRKSRNRLVKEVRNLADETDRAKRCQSPPKSGSSQYSWYLQGDGAVRNSARVAKNNHKKAVVAAAASHQSSSWYPKHPSPSSNKKIKLDPGYIEKRKDAIDYMYTQLYDADEDIESVLSPIMYALAIPHGSRADIRKIMQDLNDKKHKRKTGSKTVHDRGRSTFDWKDWQNRSGIKVGKTASQRKDTLTQRPVHPDLQFVFDVIQASEFWQWVGKLVLKLLKL